MAVPKNAVLLCVLCVSVSVRVSRSVQVPVESVAVTEPLLPLFIGEAVAVPVGVGVGDTLTDAGLDWVSVCDTEEVPERSGVGVSVWLPVREMLLEAVFVADALKVAANEAVRGVGEVAVTVGDGMRLGAAEADSVSDRLTVNMGASLSDTVRSSVAVSVGEGRLAVTVGDVEVDGAGLRVPVCVGVGVHRVRVGLAVDDAEGVPEVQVGVGVATEAVADGCGVAVSVLKVPVAE